MNNSFAPAPPAKALILFLSFKEHSYTQKPHSSNEETSVPSNKIIQHPIPWWFV